MERTGLNVVANIAPLSGILRSITLVLASHLHIMSPTMSVSENCCDYAELHITGPTMLMNYMVYIRFRAIYLVASDVAPNQYHNSPSILL